MTPVKLAPAFKDYLWGGTKLRTEFNKNCDYEKIAESWELSCHKDGPSTLCSGDDSGLTLSEYIEKHGREVLGTNCKKFDNFPVLIKLIDAKDNLSVQVHPDNEYALRVEGEYGKTEMWYIVDCEPGATLLYGFEKEISKEEFLRRIEDNTLLDVVHSVPVKKGDVFFIQAGTLHAIGKGILIAEIQQNSNTTYRVYDYGRVGADGKPRQLHVEKAAEVTELAPAKPYPEQPVEQKEGYTSRLLSQCEYFHVSLIDVSTTASMTVDSSSFQHLLILEGFVTLTHDGREMKISKGESVFLPAGMGDYSVVGECQMILTTV